MIHLCCQNHTYKYNNMILALVLLIDHVKLLVQNPAIIDWLDISTFHNLIELSNTMLGWESKFN